MAEHPVFRKPKDPNVRIWRYMDLAKYASLLEKRALFFSRADLLGDSFEGSYARANEPLRKAGPIPEESLVGISDLYRKIRRWTFINCWHMNEHESAAMWAIYANVGQAIAVQSTFAKLNAAMNSHEQVYVGTVHYIDYDREPIPEGNTFHPFVHKRLSYEHEREVRAVNQELPVSDQGPPIDWSKKPPKGLEFPLDLEELIEAVHISPGSPDWYGDVVTAVSRRFNLDVKIVSSKLDEDPFF